MYRPLPDYLTIQPSKIEGLGLFTLKYIPAYKKLGMTHAHWFGQPNNLLRTPLGGFINHSDTPNCKIIGKMTRYLYTLNNIDEGVELTLKYKMYSV
jgi:SET domain-containing protein